MKCSVNLVPLVRRQALKRSRRRSMWVIVCGLTAVLLFTGWGVQRSATATTVRQRGELEALNVQRGEVQRRLGLANEERERLLERLETLGRARPAKPWATQLAALTQRAPEGVCLTSLRIEPPSETAAAPTARRETPAAERGTPPPAAEAPSVTKQMVRLKGYALDHGQLIQMLNVLQSLRGWREVELVRATAEPFAGSHAVAFEFACEVEEVTP